MLSLSEAGWGCNYILHGVVNIFRGVLEATDIPALLLLGGKCVSSDIRAENMEFRILPYHTENPDENSRFGLVSTSEPGDDEQLLYPDDMPAALDQGGREPEELDTLTGEPSQL
jgi:hypothetical protein